MDFPKELIIDITSRCGSRAEWSSGSNLQTKKLVCINDTGILHPTTITDWSFAELNVTFPMTDHQNFIWTTIYAKDCPEKVGGLSYKIQDGILNLKELPDVDYY